MREPGETIGVETYNDGTVSIICLPANLLDYDEEPIFSALSQRGVERNRSLILNFGKVAKVNGLGADMLIKLLRPFSDEGLDRFSLQIATEDEGHPESD